MKTATDYAIEFVNAERARAGMPPLADEDENTPVGCACIRLAEAFAAAMSEAAANERERCAKVAEECWVEGDHWRRDIAATIRGHASDDKETSRG